MVKFELFSSDKSTSLYRSFNLRCKFQNYFVKIISLFSHSFMYHLFPQ